MSRLTGSPSGQSDYWSAVLKKVLRPRQYLTSTIALDLHALPRPMIVVGGGSMGAELAQTFARAGVRVTIAFRSNTLLQAELEIGATPAHRFEDEGSQKWMASAIAAGGVALELLRNRGSQVLGAERFSVATERIPNTSALGIVSELLEDGEWKVRGMERLRDRHQTRPPPRT